MDIMFAKRIKDGVNTVRIGVNDGERNEREQGRQRGCWIRRAAPLDIKRQHPAFAAGEGRSHCPRQRCSVGPGARHREDLAEIAADPARDGNRFFERP